MLLAASSSSSTGCSSTPRARSLGVWIALINVAIVRARGRRHFDLRDRLAARSRGSAGQLARAARRRDGARRSAPLRRRRADAGEERRRPPDVAAAAGGSRARRASACICAAPATRDTIVACAVFEGGKLVAQAGVSLPWDEIAASAAEQGERFLAVAVGRPLCAARCVGADRRCDRAPPVRRAAARRSHGADPERARRHADPPDQLPDVRRGQARRRLHAAAFGGPCPTAARRCCASTISICTRPASRCSPRPAKPSRCSKRGCRRPRSMPRSAVSCAGCSSRRSCWRRSPCSPA